MQLFLLSQKGTKTLSAKKVFFLALLLLVLPVAGAAFFLGTLTVSSVPAFDDELLVKAEQLKKDLEQHKKIAKHLKASSEAEINALSIRMGQLQAQMLRINAVGERVLEKSGLDADEFDFSAAPALGGADVASHGEPEDGRSLRQSIDNMFKEILEKEQQLKVLDGVLTGQTLQKSFKPAGRPVKKGWLSSHFGKRTDPFTGRKAWHHGIDFAGKEGSEVIAMASGVVTWASDKHNYGEMIEIDHGGGYVTRYGHNKNLLVEVGDIVRQGEAIATMGSTGRSTGPHVHLEVLRHGKKINPVKFVRAKR